MNWNVDFGFSHELLLLCEFVCAFRRPILRTTYMAGELITHVRHYLGFWLLNLHMGADWFFKF